MSLEAAREAWRDWLKSERRLAGHTLVAYEHDVAGFLGFMTTYLGGPPTPGGARQAETRRVPRLAGRTRAPGARPHLDGPRLLLGALVLRLPRQARARPQRQHRRHPDAQAAALGAQGAVRTRHGGPARRRRPTRSARPGSTCATRAILLLLYGAGLRIGEALGLTKVDGRRAAEGGPRHAERHRQGQQDAAGPAAAAGAGGVEGLSRRLPLHGGARARRRVLPRRARRRARSRHRAEARARASAAAWASPKA